MFREVVSMSVPSANEHPILIVGGTGKTGRRVAERLQSQGFATRLASRRGERVFDWQDTRTWSGTLEGISAAYITFSPDLAVPGAAQRVGDFATLAVQKGVERLVLLSGRGEEGAVASEDALKASGADWTILRASWFNQNFSEAFLADAVRSGDVALPAGEIAEPFTDTDDIADVACTVLTHSGHTHTTYELTGPESLTFADAVAEIATLSGKDVRYTRITPEAFDTDLSQQGASEDERWLLLELFTTVLDGRNTLPTTDIQRVLNREPTYFRDYVRKAAATGVWDL
jgi:uncharacterized protein YbjT (DUF2867 family)